MHGALHLGYHYVRNGAAPGPNCSPARLQQQIQALKSDGYEFLTCGEVTDRIAQMSPLPEKHVTLSFDDGLKDQITTALPILEEEDVPATFFIITCALDGKIPPVIGFQALIVKLGAERLEKEILPKVFEGTPFVDLLDSKLAPWIEDTKKLGEARGLRRIKWMFNHCVPQALKREKLEEMFEEYVGPRAETALVQEYFMDRSDIQALARAGMEIGSHTVTHPDLTVTGVDEIEIELGQSAATLLEMVSVLSFAWTFSSDIRSKARAVADRHYDSSWNFRSAWNKLPENLYHDLTDIPRLHEQVFNP